MTIAVQAATVLEGSSRLAQLFRCSPIHGEDNRGSTRELRKVARCTSFKIHRFRPATHRPAFSGTALPAVTGRENFGGVSTFERSARQVPQKTPVERGGEEVSGGTRLAFFRHDYARFEPHWTRWGGKQLSGE